MKPPSRVTEVNLPEVSRPGAPPPQPANRHKANPTRKRSLRVLCIDDDALIREVTRDCLRYFEHRVRVAPGGTYGIELFCIAIQEKEPYDAVITDLRMPDLDGYQVARRIKAESPRTPVIMMTGENNFTDEAGNGTPAVDAVIGKPPHLQELNELLLRVTAGLAN